MRANFKLEIESLRNEVFRRGPLGLSWDLNATIKGHTDYWVMQRFQALPSTLSEQPSLDATLLWEVYAEGLFLVNLLRDIFGNPFRPISINPVHRTPTILSLAQTAYDDRQLPSRLDTHEVQCMAVKDPNGIHRRYRKDGGLLEEGIRVAGHMEGVWRWWYPNGRLEREEFCYFDFTLAHVRLDADGNVAEDFVLAESAPQYARLIRYREAFGRSSEPIPIPPRLPTTEGLTRNNPP